MDTAIRHFPKITRRAVTLHTRDLEVCAGELAEISEESWGDICDELKVVEVHEEAFPQLVIPAPPSPGMPLFRLPVSVQAANVALFRKDKHNV